MDMLHITFHIVVFLFCCYGCQSTVDYEFKGYKTSPTVEEQSSGHEGSIHGHFQSHTTHSTRTSTYSSDGGSGTGETTFESTTYCSVDEQLEDIRTRLNILEERLHQEKDIHCCPRQQFVGFTVYLSRSVKSTPRNAIKFDHVILNEGNGYDIFTGKFTVPVSGFYSLAFFISTEDTTNSNIRMMVDGVPTLSTAVNNRNSVIQFNDRGKTGILRLYKGQRVWIETHQSINNIQGGFEDHVTSFSAALLHRI